MSNPVTVAVRILGNEYPIRCQEGQVDDLKESARSLDERLQRMRDEGRTDTRDQLAITAALNLAYDHLLMQRRMDAAAQNIHMLNERLAHAIAEHQPDSAATDTAPEPPSAEDDLPQEGGE